MSPYEPEGTLTSEKREVAVSETWDAWSNPQAMNNVEVVDGSLQLAESSTIPDSVVSRDPDNDSSGNDFDVGLRFETSQEWGQIQAEISQNTVDPVDAILERVSDGTVMDQVDVSSMSPGDVFTFDNAGLSANTEYDLYLSGGSSFNYGYNNSTSFPYTSSDGNLSITNGVVDGSGSDGLFSIVTIGNINL